MAESTPAQARPVSPHVQLDAPIWRWHITMFTSIAHRATGVALYVGALILAGWALALASGPQAYGAYMALLGSIPGKIVMFGLTVSVFYHLAAGVRHLVWDVGSGFEVKSAVSGSWLILGFTLVASIGVWVLAFATGAA